MELSAAGINRRAGGKPREGWRNQPVIRVSIQSDTLRLRLPSHNLSLLIAASTSRFSAVARAMFETNSTRITRTA